MNLRNELNRFLLPLRRKVSAMVAKAVVDSYNHTTGLPVVRIQLSDDEIRDNIPSLQPYGFASRPDGNAEGLVLFVAGEREHGVAVVIDDSQTRITLGDSGDVAIYRRTGEKVYLSQGKIHIDANEIELGSAGEKLMNKIAMDAFNSHTHLVQVEAPPVPPIPSLTPTIPMVENIHTTIQSKAG